LCSLTVEDLLEHNLEFDGLPPRTCVWSSTNGGLALFGWFSLWEEGMGLEGQKSMFGPNLVGGGQVTPPLKSVSQ
jgi:hypothetical protein